jgi:CheY-like chemotaxis protein
MEKDPRPLILVVDDEEMVRLALEMVLNSEGYRTMAAGDGMEAIEMLKREDVALVITDMKMPRAGGQEVLKAAKEKNPDTRVIMITGFTAEDPSAAVSKGADDFIYKVFKRDDILRAVARFIPPPRPAEGR